MRIKALSNNTARPEELFVSALGWIFFQPHRPLTVCLRLTQKHRASSFHQYRKYISQTFHLTLDPAFIIKKSEHLPIKLNQGTGHRAVIMVIPCPCLPSIIICYSGQYFLVAIDEIPGAEILIWFWFWFDFDSPIINE